MVEGDLADYFIVSGYNRQIFKNIKLRKMIKLLQKSLIIAIASAIQFPLAISSQAETKAQQTSKQPQPQNSQMQKFVFDFNNAYDYAACLDVILLSYEQRNAELENASKNDCATKVLNTFGDNLPKERALELVELADLHATKRLEDPLYPSLGLRRRIAINLGYIYDMDKNNPDVLKYIDSKNN